MAKDLDSVPTCQFLFLYRAAFIFSQHLKQSLKKKKKERKPISVPRLEKELTNGTPNTKTPEGRKRNNFEFF